LAFLGNSSFPGLGSEIQPGGDRLLRFLSPPWRGNMKMLVTPDGELIIDAAQHKYTFSKIAQLFSIGTG
jgi:hypothetical protein